MAQPLSLSEGQGKEELGAVGPVAPLVDEDADCGMATPDANSGTATPDANSGMATPTLQVLYLFSGPQREGDLEECLKELSGSDATITCRDLCRGSHHDFMVDDVRQSIFEEVRRGRFDCIIVTPPCGTWSRAMWSGRPGPRPIRSKEWPLGFPWLAKAKKDAADIGNSLVFFALDIIRAAAEVKSKVVNFLMEHPEDLGTRPCGTPASIWQLPEAQDLMGKFHTFGLHQCALGGDRPKPTRILTNMEGLIHTEPGGQEILGYPGPPECDKKGKYKGPLPSLCGHIHQTGLGRDGNDFETKAWAHYPKNMNMWIAKHVLATKDIDNMNIKDFTGVATAGEATQPATTIDDSLITEKVLDDRPPTIPVPLLPSRASLAGLRKIDGDMVYIGRGSKAWDLKPSLWGNFGLRVRKGYSQKACADGYIDELLELLSNPDHQVCFKELAGKRLLCHCKASEPCHADTIIQHFTRSLATPEGGEVVDKTPTNIDLKKLNEDKVTDKIEEMPTSDEEQDGSRRPKKGDGWRGSGPPLTFNKKLKRVEVQDGAGHCSPGRWPRETRKLPESPCLQTFRGFLVDALRKWEADLGVKGINLRNFVLMIAGGKVLKTPFGADFIEETRRGLTDILRQHGFDTVEKEGDRKQSIKIRLLQSFLRACGDPDSGFLLDTVAKGVPTGGRCKLPRTPAVFDRKVKYAVPEVQPGETSEWADNYTSVKERPQVIRDQFIEEEKLGFMIKMTEKEAKARWGDHVLVAALGAIPKTAEPEPEYRVIFDGTHWVLLNKRIRVRDLVRMPTVRDIRAVFSWIASKEAGPRFALTWDVQHAHRLVPVEEEDCGLQACRLDDFLDELWINLVGTFGVASAGYWWGRLAAAVMRARHYALGHLFSLWSLLYADDGTDIACSSYWERPLMLGLLFMQILGVPLSWKKCRGGLQYDWIGYWLDIGRFAIGINASRVDWIKRWSEKVIADRMIRIGELKQALGRLSFVTGPLLYLRPFLGPLYAWASACPRQAVVTIPIFLLLILKAFAQEVVGSPTLDCALLHRELGDYFRVDAKAEGNDVCIGGWRSRGGAKTMDAPWFMLTLTSKNAPWAFQKGEPFRTIAALELLGVLVGIIALVDSKADAGSHGGRITLTAYTDNQGNGYLLDKLLTTKMPLGMILLELGCQLQKHRLDLELQWIPRDQNTEADDLTNGRCDDFDPNKRIVVDLATLPFVILPSLLETAGEYEEHIAKAKELKEADTLKRLPAAKRLRETDPW